MPNCPNCGTWKPKRTTFLGLPIWAWVVLVLFFVMTTFGQCMFIGGPPA